MKPLSQKRGEFPADWCTVAVASSSALRGILRYGCVRLFCVGDDQKLKHDNSYTNQMETAALGLNVTALGLSRLRRPVYVFNGTFSGRTRQKKCG